MALHYHSATRLSELFDPLYQAVRAERRILRPQTPQTIVVGNLDTEAWLQRRFLDADEILMSVNFPFLEAAIENLVLRLAGKIQPSASESWFSAPAAAKVERHFAGMVEIETLLLTMLGEKPYEKLFLELGYAVTELTPLQRVSLARNLAGTLREHLLHVPHSMQKLRQKKPAAKTAPIGQLWFALASEFEKKELLSPLLQPEQAQQLIAGHKISADQGALYLFGMPLLSAYHILLLASIAGFCDVHLFAVEPPQDPTFLGGFNLPAAACYGRYRKLLTGEAASQKVQLIAHAAPETQEKIPLPRLEMWGLPGKWRGAELLADHWHKELLNDMQLRQEDVAVALSDPEGQFAAFELAGTKRELSISTKHKVLQKPQPIVELMGIFSEAAIGGMTRSLLIDYLENPAVKRAYGLTPELVELFARAFETAHAYRDDYPESQSAFNFSDALQRIFRGSVLDGRGVALSGVPGHAIIAEFDSAETADTFLRCSNFLLRSAKRLSALRGAALLATTKELFADSPFSGDESLQPVLELIARILRAGLPADLTAAQLTAIFREYVPGTALLHSQSSEGISLSPLSAVSFTRAYQTIFDVNEDLEAKDIDETAQLPDYKTAPTKLTAEEQLRISIIAALSSGCRELLFAYSDIDPTTGADKYPARQIEALRAALAAEGIELTRRTAFSQTILQLDGEHDLPVASQGDADTMRLIAAGRTSDAPLVALLSPAAADHGERRLYSLADLERFLFNPAVAQLSQHGIVPDEPVDFRRDEPGLSISTGARLKFCEEYLHAVLLSAAEDTAPDAVAAIVQKQLNGSGAPDGFDHAKAMLAANGNNERLANTATAEREKTRLVEYIFHEKVASAFAVQETERFERRYLPAVRIDDVLVTGRSGFLLERDDATKLVLLDTSVADYSKRTPLLIKAHLLFAALQAATKRSDLPLAIEIAKYQIGKSDAEKEILQQEYAVVATIRADAIEQPETYLRNLIAALNADNFFWFDLGAFLPSKKLAVFAEKEDDDILSLLEENGAGGFDAARSEFIRRFYDLKPSSESAHFFNKFIRPVAAIDALAEAAGKKGKKRG